MTDHDDSEYEERLRQVLRQVPSPRANADAVLARVETGARRRVRRRRVGGAVAGVAAVAAAAVFVVPTLDDQSHVADGPNDMRTHKTDRLHGTQFDKRGSAALGDKRASGRTTDGKGATAAGEATKASNVAVSGIALSESGDLSVIGQGSCTDGPCLVTGSPTASTDFRVAPTKDRLLKTMKWNASASAATEPGIQVGSDEKNSWAWTDGLYATHDAGKTWRPVRLPQSMNVEDVQSADGRVWAFGTRADSRAAVASSHEGGDKWVKESVPVSSTETIEVPTIVHDSPAFVVADRQTKDTRFVSRNDSSWMRNPLPCRSPIETSSVGDTVWIACGKNGKSTVSWTHDGGATWDSMPVEPQGLSTIGAVDAETAVVAIGKQLYRVDAAGKALVPTEAPFKSADAWGDTSGYTTIRFDDEGTGYATTTGGALARSDDKGTTWKPESLQ